MKLYILFADYEDSGERENWCVFYCGAEAFDSAKKREERKQWILANSEDSSEIEFCEYEIDLNPAKDSEHPLVCSDAADQSTIDQLRALHPSNLDGLINEYLKGDI